MKDADDTSGPRPSNPPADPPPSGRAQREARLAKALRENLRRRKAAGRDAPADPSGD